MLPDRPVRRAAPVDLELLAVLLDHDARDVRGRRLHCVVELDAVGLRPPDRRLLLGHRLGVELLEVVDPPLRDDVGAALPRLAVRRSAPRPGASSIGGFSVPSMKPVMSRLSRYTKHGRSARASATGASTAVHGAGCVEREVLARSRAPRSRCRAGSTARGARRARRPGRTAAARPGRRPAARARRHRSAPNPMTRLNPPAVTVGSRRPGDRRGHVGRRDARAHGRTRGCSANGCPARRSPADRSPCRCPPALRGRPRLVQVTSATRADRRRVTSLGSTFGVGLDRRARAHDVAVAVRAVDPADRRPVLVPTPPSTTARSRVYACSQASVATSAAGCGACGERAVVVAPLPRRDPVDLGRGSRSSRRRTGRARADPRTRSARSSACPAPGSSSSARGTRSR